jgi:hypothetical protein
MPPDITAQHDSSNTFRTPFERESAGWHGKQAASGNTTLGAFEQHSNKTCVMATNPTLKRISSSLHALQMTASHAFTVSITLPVRGSTAWQDGHTT